jgi:uncharacterized membrane protein
MVSAWMGRRRLMQKLELGRIEGAIREAERQSSGEIRVSVAPFFWGSVDRAAWRAFERLGMAATRRHNGVLIFVVPARRRFVVLGDEGIHAAVGQAFWDRVAEAISASFREHRFTEGIVRGVEAVGEALREYFPREPGDVNELPDKVDVGRR